MQQLPIYRQANRVKTSLWYKQTEKSLHINMDGTSPKPDVNAPEILKLEESSSNLIMHQEVRFNLHGICIDTLGKDWLKTHKRRQVY